MSTTAAASTKDTDPKDIPARHHRLRRMLRAVSPVVYGALLSGAVLAPLVAAGTTSDLNAYLVVTAAVTGAIAGTVIAVHRTMRPRLGALTAAAGTCTVSGVTLFAIMALTPNCPGATGRCSASEIGAWTLSGVLLSVASFSLMLFLPMLRSARRLLRAASTRARQLHARGATEGSASPERRNKTKDRRAKRRRQSRARRTNRNSRHH